MIRSLEIPRISETQIFWHLHSDTILSIRLLLVRNLVLSIPVTLSSYDILSQWTSGTADSGHGCPSSCACRVFRARVSASGMGRHARSEEVLLGMCVYDGV